MVEYHYGMDIITQLPKISNSEVDKALMRELREGLHLKRATEEARARVAAERAAELKGHKTMKGLGKAVAAMPDWEYFRLVQKYGINEVHSKDFMRFFQKKFPHLSPNKV